MFLFHAPAPTQLSTLSLHDALPIFHHLDDKAVHQLRKKRCDLQPGCALLEPLARLLTKIVQSRSENGDPVGDRKSTRLNSSHVRISYAVFCLKKKSNPAARHTPTSP